MVFDHPGFEVAENGDSALVEFPVDFKVAFAEKAFNSKGYFLLVESPNIGKLSSMYMYAWQRGLKTTYYLRSRPATRIAQTQATPLAPSPTETEALSCSLENPEACESCQ